MEPDQHNEKENDETIGGEEEEKRKRDNEIIICSQCNGKGKVTDYGSFPVDPINKLLQNLLPLTCSRCNGSGRLTRWESERSGKAADRTSSDYDHDIY